MDTTLSCLVLLLITWKIWGRTQVSRILSDFASHHIICWERVCCYLPVTVILYYFVIFGHRFMKNGIALLMFFSGDHINLVRAGKHKVCFFTFSSQSLALCSYIELLLPLLIRYCFFSSLRAVRSFTSPYLVHAYVIVYIYMFGSISSIFDLILDLWKLSSDLNQTQIPDVKESQSYNARNFTNNKEISFGIVILWHIIFSWILTSTHFPCKRFSLFFLWTWKFGLIQKLT